MGGDRGPAPVWGVGRGQHLIRIGECLGVSVSYGQHEVLLVDQSPGDDLGGLLNAPLLPGGLIVSPGCEATELEESLVDVFGEVVVCPGVAHFMQDRPLRGHEESVPVETANVNVCRGACSEDTEMAVARLFVIVECDAQGGR